MEKSLGKDITDVMRRINSLQTIATRLRKRIT